MDLGPVAVSIINEISTRSAGKLLRDGKNRDQSIESFAVGARCDSISSIKREEMGYSRVEVVVQMEDAEGGE